MAKKIWRKNFEIKKVSFFLPYEALDVFYKFQKKFVGKMAIDQVIWINEGVDGKGTYFLKDQLRENIEKTLETIINKPELASEIHQKTIKYNQDFFNFLKKVRKYNFKKLSDNQLIRLYKKILKDIRITHGTSICSTWFIDSDGEDLTNYLLNYLKNQIDKNEIKINFAQAFSILTTPTEKSMAQIESEKSLNILKLIKLNKNAKKIFLSKNINVIENNLDKLNPKLKRKIIKHHYDWCWTPYTYIGPAYNLNYYLEIWSSLLRQKININAELKKLKDIHQKNKTTQEKIIKKLKIDNQHKKIFEVAKEIVWLKAFRKDVMFFAHFIVDMINKEISRRGNISFTQARYLTDYEIEDLLLKDKIDLDEINQRMKFFVFYLNKGKNKILTGKKAKNFLAKQNFEKVTIKDVNELSGTPACPGKVKGKVKIINIPEEMSKMNKNDIMVSHTTFPALVPAMKKASAIVTDDGGLTCHAAIVARELKTPCVVGVKMATTILKDGNEIEVDANNGIIKKL